MIKALIDALKQKISESMKAKDYDPDEWVVKARDLGKIVEQFQTEEGWHPIEEGPPQPDTMVLVSFENPRIVEIGIYAEDEQGSGAFYTIGVQELKFMDFDLIVNAWMELPKSYRVTSEQKRFRKEIMDDFMKKARI